MCVKTQEGIPGQTPSILTALGTSQLILALLLPPCPQGVSAAKPILHKKFLPTSHLSEKGLELVQVLEDAR